MDVMMTGFKIQPLQVYYQLKYDQIAQRTKHTTMRRCASENLELYY